MTDDASPVWPFDQAPNVAAISDAAVVDRDAPILLAVHYSSDDSWAFLWETVFDVSHGKVIGMGEALGIDATLREIADLPPGWTASRHRVGAPWVRCRDPEV